MPALSRVPMGFAAACLATGVTMGAWFAGHPEFGPQFRQAHATLNLFGWVVMMITGVAYYLIPRMFGRPLRSSALAVFQIAATGAGVLLLTTGIALRIRWSGPDWPIVAGGVTVAVGIVLLAVNLGLTMRGMARSGQTISPLPMVRRPGRPSAVPMRVR